MNPSWLAVSLLTMVAARSVAAASLEPADSILLNGRLLVFAGRAQ
jgi:hypothetical protein